MAGHLRRRPARLLVLGAGAAQLGLLEAAAARDVTVIAVDRDPLAVGFALADERAVISSEDEEGIERLARARAVDGIVSPGADWPVGIAARVAERLGLPHPIDGATAVVATTKTRQRERFGAAGVLQPRTFSVGDPGITFPCVVKAPDRQGQRGLTLVREASALAAAVEAARAESRGGGVLVEELIDGPELTVNAVSRAGTFVPLTVTDRILADPPAFGVALAHAWPSAQPTDGVVEAARAAVAALGIENGPSYTQLRIGPGGRAYVVEVAARLGGGHDAELCRVAVGVDLNDLAVSFALGQDPCDKLSQASFALGRDPCDELSQGRSSIGLGRGGKDELHSASGSEPQALSSVGVDLDDRGSPVGVDEPRNASGSEPQALSSVGIELNIDLDDRGSPVGVGEPRNASGSEPQALSSVGGACVLFLVAPEGVLRATEGVDAAEAVAGVEWVRIYRQPGWRFGPLRRGADRAGAILATGDDRADALARARRAAEAVRFQVDATPA